MKTVKIDVDKQVPRFELEKLQPLQGELKSLSDTNYEKLKSSILKHGFFVPIFAWRVPGKSGGLQLLDGHQRIRVLTRMKSEGWEIPALPVVVLSAKNEVDAKERLLAISSHFGKFERQGLYEFSKDLDLEKLIHEFDLPGIEPFGFIEEFFVDPKDIVADPWEGMPEFSSEDQLAHRTLKVHFATDHHVQEFARLIGQQLTEKTKFVWHPKAERQVMADKGYVNQNYGDMPDVEP